MYFGEIGHRFYSEKRIPQATALRNDFYSRGAVKAIAPHLLIYEVTNGILTAVRRKRLVSDKALEALNNLMELGVELREVEPEMILKLSLAHNPAAYDAAYLALLSPTFPHSVLYKALHHNVAFRDTPVFLTFLLELQPQA